MFRLRHFVVSKMNRELSKVGATSANKSTSVINILTEKSSNSDKPKGLVEEQLIPKAKEEKYNLNIKSSFVKAATIAQIVI